jgi:hypothetical protein
VDIEFTEEFRLSSLRESNRHLIGDQHSGDSARPAMSVHASISDIVPHCGNARSAKRGLMHRSNDLPQTLIYERPGRSATIARADAMTCRLGGLDIN